MAVATAAGMHQPADITDVNINKMMKLPAGATSSMHDDFKNNKNTELKMLTGYVVQQAEYGASAPAYARQYAALKVTAVQS